MDVFLTATVTGLCTAAIYAVAASGLVLTYTTTGIFNFAHGAIGMFGAFTYWQLAVGWDWPVWLSLAVVLLVVGPLIGTVVEVLIMRALRDAPEITRLVVTVSLLVAFLGLGLWLWSPQESHPVDPLFPGKVLRIGDVNVTYHLVATFVVAVAVAIGLRLLLYRTRTGLAMRAAVDDRSLAMLTGARPGRSAIMAWAIGCSLAALAGILQAGASVGMLHLPLTLLIVNAFAAAIIGRLRSLPLTFAGAVVLGLANDYAIAYLHVDNQYLKSFRFAIPSLVLFCVLVVLPPARLRGVVAGRAREVVPNPRWSSALAIAGSVVALTVLIASLVSDADALRTSQILGIALVALSLVPLVGFAGLPVLCPMTFAGIGAVVYAQHAESGDVWPLLLAAVAGGAAGALVALPALRLTGIELALGTAAFAVGMQVWGFQLPPFDVGPWTIRFFEFGTLGMGPVDMPLVDTTSSKGQLIFLSVVFALLYLGVVAIRRSGFGQRLLALKTSPAAAATIGLDVTRLRLQVFALSGAMAAFGGALYGGTLGSISADNFQFFASLPVLLLAVVGGVASASGALFAGVMIAGAPIAISAWPSLANPNRVLPGLMGLGLGQNPNGAVEQIAEGYRPVRQVRAVLVATFAAVAAIIALRGATVITSSQLVYAFIGLLLVAPGAATLLLARRERSASDEVGLEWAGVSRPFTADEIAALHAELAS